MKLMIASDIHGSKSAAQKVLDAFEKEAAAYLVYLGDLMYHGPRNPLPDQYAPAQVAELFNDYKDQIFAIAGNCDSDVDQLLCKFPITATYQNIPLDEGKLFATHGHIYAPTPDLANIPNSVVADDIFAFGHIHLPILQRDAVGRIILNPGSAALPKEGHPPTYAIITDAKIEIKTFDGLTYMELAR